MLTVVDTGPDIFGCGAVRKVWSAAESSDDDDGGGGGGVNDDGPTGPNGFVDDDDGDLSAAVCIGVGDGVNDLLAPCIACAVPFGVTERVVFDALFERGLPVYGS